MNSFFKWSLRLGIVLLLALSFWPAEVVRFTARVPLVGKYLAMGLSSLTALMPWCKEVDAFGWPVAVSNSNKPAEGKSYAVIEERITRIEKLVANVSSSLKDVSVQMSLIANSGGSGTSPSVVGSLASWRLSNVNDPVRLASIPGVELKDGVFTSVDAVATGSPWAKGRNVVLHFTQLLKPYRVPGSGGDKGENGSIPASAAAILSNALESDSFSHLSARARGVGVGTLHIDRPCKAGTSFGLALVDEDRIPGGALVPSTEFDILFVFREEVSTRHLADVVVLQNGKSGFKWNVNITEHPATGGRGDDTEPGWTEHIFYASMIHDRDVNRTFGGIVWPALGRKSGSSIEAQTQYLEAVPTAGNLSSRNWRGSFPCSLLRSNVLRVTVPRGTIPSMEMIFPASMSTLTLKDILYRSVV